MPVRWAGEAFDYPPDPETGVERVRMTTSLYHHVNVYCEFACSSPDGRRFTILRSNFCDPRQPPYDLMVGDLNKLQVTVVESGVTSNLVATASWSGWIYYLNARNELMRVNLESLDKEVVWTRWPFDPDFVLLTVSPDLRFMVGQRSRRDFVTELVRIDLVEREWKVIYADPEISNAHALYNPIHGRDIIVMKAGGFGVNDLLEVKQLGTPRIVSHFYIDNEGKNLRTLPFGGPKFANSTGHSNWLGDTGMMTHTGQTRWENNRAKLYPEFPDGNIFYAAPGDAAPRRIKAPQYAFNHIATSRCGRYFVAESYAGGLPGPVPLIVGNFQTGKHRPLLMDCQASGGAAAVGHPHAYFTADSKHVIYNANPTMIGHVWAARIPDGFLAGLA